ncbi:MAG: FGGY family carbohydrate kinase [Pseudomonadota bacterium]
MSAGLILGIDVGTTSVKAGLVGQDSRVVASFAESYPTRRSAGGVVEQDARDWLRLVDRAVAQVSGHRSDILAVGLCSQVNTHVFLGADDQPLMPAIVWQDGRAKAEAAELDARVDEAQKIAWWGAPMPIDASHALPRMLWVARHRPDIWAATRRVMLPKDYCLLHLTGDAGSDPLSNIGLVNSALDYIPGVFDLVPGSFDKMAPLVPVTGLTGRMRVGGPLAGVPVVSGTMDAWAGLVGAGAAREGASVYLSGTSEIMGIAARTVVPTPGAIIFPVAAGIRLHAAPTQSGGDAARWFAETADLPLDDLSDLVARTPRGDATPLFLPQLEGERAPFWDTSLRGAFLGLSRRSGPGDLGRAVFEGVALSARQALELLQASAATVSDHVACGGGGFRSDAWTQIRADVLGVPLRPLEAEEPGMLGAATIAAVGFGEYDSLRDAQGALARYKSDIEPSAEAHAHYSELLEIYKDTIGTNADLGRRLTDLAFRWPGPNEDV